MPTYQKLLAAIKAKCLDCCASSKEEVRCCRIKECPLYPYRLGDSQQVLPGISPASPKKPPHET